MSTPDEQHFVIPSDLRMTWHWITDDDGRQWISKDDLLAYLRGGYLHSDHPAFNAAVRYIADAIDETGHDEQKEA